MKQLVIIVTQVLFLAWRADCQRLSVDMMPGMINYLGDLQPRAFTFIESRPALQAGISYRLTDNFFLRAFYLVGTVHADDKKGDPKYAAGRNLNFTSVIKEGSVSIEFDLFKVGGDKKITPYLFGGAGFFHFNPYTYDTMGKKIYLRQLNTEGEGLPEYPNRKPYSLYQFNFLGGFGVKYALTEHFYVGFEVCFHKLFTDYLDDVSNTYADKNILLAERGPEAVELAFRGDELKPPHTYPRAGSVRGNPKANDDYYTGLLRFTYNFVNSNAGFKLNNKRSLQCPKFVL